MSSFHRVLVLAITVILLFLVFRHTSTPSQALAFGSARSRLQSLKLANAKGNKPPVSTSPLKSGFTDNDFSPSYNSRHKQIPLGDITRKPLRQRLAYYFPYEPTAKFPAYIWQTWKTTPSSGDFRDEWRPLEAAWSDLHPGFVHEVLTDEIAGHILRHLYSAVPDVISAYEALPRPVLKADFFRYLILLARGGIYSDIDTQAIRSVVDWVPSTVPRSAYGLVVGIEADPDRPDWADWYSRRIQFCQWTIQAKPGHPVLREIVAAITEKTLARKRDGTLSAHDVHEVVEFTGPAVWTDILMAYFNDEAFFDMSISKGNITWKQFTGMTQARKVGDVVVLPITAFSPGIETMGAGPDDDPMAMVKHYFDGKQPFVFSLAVSANEHTLT